MSNVAVLYSKYVRGPVTDLRQYHSFWHREQRLAAGSPHTAHLGGSVIRLSNTSRLYVSAMLYNHRIYTCTCRLHITIHYYHYYFSAAGFNVQAGRPSEYWPVWQGVFTCVG